MHTHTQTVIKNIISGYSLLFHFIIFFFLGTGKSKKVAKRNAASLMLSTLKQGAGLPTGEKGEGGEEFDEENINLVLTSYFKFKKKLTNRQIQWTPLKRTPLGLRKVSSKVACPLQQGYI